MFCHGMSRTGLSKEHLLSEPVCRAFRVDRTVVAARVDGSARRVNSVARLGDTQVRLPCRACNSGWMNELENGMERLVAPWARGRRARLGEGALAVLTRWALKTHIVLGALDGGIRAFGSDKSDSKMGVIPEATRAHQLYEDNPAAVTGVTVGVARVAKSEYLWGFGNPTVIPKGPQYANARSATVTCLNLRCLQLWVIAPVFSTATVRLPPRVQRVAATLVFAHLPYTASGKPPLDAVIVDNGPHDIDAVCGNVRSFLAGTSRAPVGGRAF